MSSDCLTFTHAEPLEGYQAATIRDVVSNESIVVELGFGANRHDVVLRTYNSYCQVTDQTFRPLVADDLSKLHPGSRLLVKLREDGQLVGVVPPTALSPKRRFKLF